MALLPDSGSQEIADPKPVGSGSAVTEQPNGHLVRALQNGASIVAAAVIVYCFIVLLAWIFDITALKSVRAGWASLSVPTAVAFILSGCAILELTAERRNRRPRPLLLRAFAGLVLLLALYDLGAYAFGSGFGLGGALASRGYIFGPGLGQMAPATATGFALLSLALLAERRHAQAYALLAAFGLILAGLDIAGYAYGVTALYAVAPFAAMALPTAIAFALSFICLLLARPQHGWMARVSASDGGGAAARRLLPAVILLPFTLSWLAVTGVELGAVQGPFGFAAVAAAATFLLGAIICRVSASLSRSEAELKRFEAHAARERTRLVEAIDALPVYFMLFDSDDRLVIANAGQRAQYAVYKDALVPGLSIEEFIRIQADNTLAAESVGRQREWMKERLAKYRSGNIDLEAEGSDGRWFRVIERRTSDGGTASIRFEITELKKAEREVAEAKRRSDELVALLDTLQSSSPIGIGFVDREFRYVRVNDALAAGTGLSVQEMIGRKISEVLPERWSRLKPIYESILETGEPILNIEVSTETPEGRRHWLVSRYPVWIADEIIGFGLIVVEVTERRQLEEQLRQAQKLEAVGQLTGGVAHDFNNLLAVVIGNLELLDEGGAPESEKKAQLRPALQAAIRGAELTQRLLAFSRRQPLDPRPIDLGEIVTGMMGLLRRTLGETIAIRLSTESRLWPCLADPRQLESALLNLAINARDAMPNGGRILIEMGNISLDKDYVAHHQELTPGDYVMVSVSDEGIGMSEEVRSRAFEPFFTTKEVGKGSGLGLSMVYGFVKQSGGHVSIYSEPSQGTTVKLYLPCAAEAAEAVERPVAMPGAMTLGRPVPVLVVEDQPDVRDLVRRLFTGFGCPVFEAENALSALDALDSHPEIGLLFTDVVLPNGMNGAQLAAEAQRRRPGLKVIHTSGYTEDAVVHHGRLDPDVYFLSKPYRRDKLFELVQAVLSGR